MATQTSLLDHVRSAAGSIREPEPTSQILTLVEVSLLGGFEVRVDGRAIPPDRWSRRHSAALVKLLALALAPSRSLHREQVIDALWPDLDVDVAAPRLHKAAHYARRALGHRDAVVLTGETVRLGPSDDVHVDAVQFQRVAEAALDTGGIAAAKGALAVHRGELLPHDPYAPWADQHRLQLSHLHTELLHQAEDWHQALSPDPTDEPAHLALARRHAEIGDRGAALRQLDQLDQVMRHELGLEPSEHAVALRRRLLVTTPVTPASRAVTAVGHDAAPHAIDPREPCCT